jgi:Leucine-rich repeat (LRR) protein
MNRTVVSYKILRSFIIFCLFFSAAVLPAKGSFIQAQATPVVKISLAQGLSASNAFSCDDVTEIPKAECEALVDFYHSTGGPDWKNNYGWLDALDPCEWNGISCYEGHVSEIWFSYNDLQGQIPASISAFTDITSLILHRNSFPGTIPSEVWALSSLERLNLSGNGFVGEIPESINQLTKLSSLDLSYNALDGNLPAGLWDLIELEYLRLIGNEITGVLPDSIEKLSKLKIIFLDENNFSGAIPAELGLLTHLKDLSLRHNQFSGNIPTSLQLLTNLEYLDLSENQLSGELPVELWDLAALRYLHLDQNQFSGGIPASIGKLAYLEHLDLSTNQFSGPFPEQIWTIPNLYYLNLAKNRFSGTLPDEIRFMPNLTTLNIFWNKFSGEIPYEITYLTKLSNTDIGYNYLYSNNPTVRAFLNEKDPDWASTQASINDFVDVPADYWAAPYIYAIKDARITAGCGVDLFCPTLPVYRGDMAIFLLRGMEEPGYNPPAATGIFTDVSLDNYYANWVEQLYHEGVTGGCSLDPMSYCPSAKVTRAQMAVFLLKAKHGKEYQPPAAQGIFSDVQPGTFYEPWIEQLAEEGITAGCGVGLYCPSSPVTRAQMAVFLARAFELPIP